MSKPSQRLLSLECSYRVHVCLFPDVCISHMIQSRLSSCPQQHAYFSCVQFPLLLSNCPIFCSVHHVPKKEPFIAVLYTLSFNFVGMFMSHITPIVSLQFDHTILFWYLVNNYVFLPWKDNAVVNAMILLGMTVQWLDRMTFDREVLGSNPTGTASELWATLFTWLCQCLSEVTLKAVGPFYLVSMPWEVKYPTQGGKCVTWSGLHHS